MPQGQPSLSQVPSRGRCARRRYVSPLNRYLNLGRARTLRYPELETPPYRQLDPRRGMAAAAEAERRRRRKVKLLLTNILGTNGQPSVTHVPFFFVRITPCTTFPIEKVLFNLPLLGPIFHFWVAKEHLHGICYRPTCSGCRSPITRNGLFCSCNFGPFLMNHRSYDGKK